VPQRRFRKCIGVFGFQFAVFGKKKGSSLAYLRPYETMIQGYDILMKRIVGRSHSY
jgi:hypothetical protein